MTRPFTTKVRANDTTTCLRNHLLHNHKAVHAEYKEKRLRELKQHFKVGLGYFTIIWVKFEWNFDHLNQF